MKKSTAAMKAKATKKATKKSATAMARPKRGNAEWDTFCGHLVHWLTEARRRK